MSATFAIAKRDFKSMFDTPLGWLSSCLIFTVSGVVFYIITRMMLDRGSGVDPVGELLQPMLQTQCYFNIFIIPAFTMRVMSDELNTGTYRLAAGSPVSSAEIIFGKFLGLMMYFALICGLMLIYPLYTSLFSSPDLRVMMGGWAALLLNTAIISSIGLFVGSLTKNPVSSYLFSALTIIVLIFSAYIPGMPDWYKEVVNLMEMGNMARGKIVTGKLAVFVSFISIFLFLSRLVWDSKRWKV